MSANTEGTGPMSDTNGERRREEREIARWQGRIESRLDGAEADINMLGRTLRGVSDLVAQIRTDVALIRSELAAMREEGEHRRHSRFTRAEIVAGSAGAIFGPLISALTVLVLSGQIK